MEVIPSTGCTKDRYNLTNKNKKR